MNSMETPAPLPPAIEAALSELVAGLTSPDTDTRLTFIAYLGNFGLPEVLDLAMVRLGHEMREAEPALRQGISQMLLMLQVEALRLRVPGGVVPGWCACWRTPTLKRVRRRPGAWAM